MTSSHDLGSLSSFLFSKAPILFPFSTSLKKSQNSSQPPLSMVRERIFLLISNVVTNLLEFVYSTSCAINGGSWTFHTSSKSLVILGVLNLTYSSVLKDTHLVSLLITLSWQDRHGIFVSIKSVVRCRLSFILPILILSQWCDTLFAEYAFYSLSHSGRCYGY